MEKTEDKYRYCRCKHITSTSSLLKILTSLDDEISEVFFNFSFSPLNYLPFEEYEKLNHWFTNLFEERERAYTGWQDYQAIKEKDITFGGFNNYTNSWSDSFAFEASFGLNYSEPVRFSFLLFAGDPSFIVYLISSLLEDYNFEYRGDHYISIDRQPEKLSDYLD